MAAYILVSELGNAKLWVDWAIELIQSEGQSGAVTFYCAESSVAMAEGLARSPLFWQGDTQDFELIILPRHGEVVRIAPDGYIYEFVRRASPGQSSYDIWMSIVGSMY